MTCFPVSVKSHCCSALRLHLEACPGESRSLSAVGSFHVSPLFACDVDVDGDVDWSCHLVFGSSLHMDLLPRIHNIQCIITNAHCPPHSYESRF